MPPMMMEHSEDPKQALLNKIGDISDFKVFHNNVLVAVYLRPEKTESGLYLPDSVRDEDRYQSKVGLLVKLGPDAFSDDSGKWFKDVDVKLHDWVWFRPSDSFSLTLNDSVSGGKVLCRLIEDTLIKGTIPHPDAIW